MIQIVRQTWQERYDMYMSMSKEELATMLAESAKYTNPDACAEFEDSSSSSSISVTSEIANSGYTNDCFFL